MDVIALSNQRSETFVLAVHSRTSFAALLIHKRQPVGVVEGGTILLWQLIWGRE